MINRKYILTPPQKKNIFQWKKYEFNSGLTRKYLEIELRKEFVLCLCLWAGSGDLSSWLPFWTKHCMIFISKSQMHDQPLYAGWHRSRCSSSAILNWVYFWLTYLIVVLRVLIYWIDSSFFIFLCLFLVCIVRRHSISQLHSDRPQAQHNVWVLSHGDKEQKIKHVEHDGPCHHLWSWYVKRRWL